MGALVVLLAGCLLGVAVVLLRRRNTQVFPADERRDGPQRLLAASVTLLATDRAEWGQAMVGELDRLTARGKRWRFVLGCARATLLLPPRRGAGRLIVTAVASAAVACAGLVGYGLVRYPGLLTGARSWVSVAAFLAVLVGYSVTANIIVRRMAAPALDAVRVALMGATAIAALGIVAGVTGSFGGSDYLIMMSLLALPLVSLSVGALGAWRGRTASTGRQATVLLALGTGLLVFLVWVGDTLLTSGRPYDAGMVRDFHSSGGHDLATYAVSDNMGSAMMLLLLVPLLVASFGLTAAAITARLVRRAPTTD